MKNKAKKIRVTAHSQNDNYLVFLDTSNRYVNKEELIMSTKNITTIADMVGFYGLLNTEFSTNELYDLVKFELSKQ